MWLLIPDCHRKVRRDSQKFSTDFEKHLSGTLIWFEVPRLFALLCSSIIPWISSLTFRRGFSPSNLVMWNDFIPRIWKRLLLPVAAILSITSELFSSKVRTFNLCICQLRSSLDSSCSALSRWWTCWDNLSLGGRPLLTYICIGDCLRRRLISRYF